MKRWLLILLFTALLSWAFWLPGNPLPGRSCVYVYAGCSLTSRTLTLSDPFASGTLGILLNALGCAVADPVTSGRLLVTLYFLLFVTGGVLLLELLRAPSYLFMLLPVFALTNALGRGDFSIMFGTAFVLLAIAGELEYFNRPEWLILAGWAAFNVLIYLADFYLFLFAILLQLLLFSRKIRRIHLLFLAMATFLLPLLHLFLWKTRPPNILDYPWSALTGWYTSAFGFLKGRLQPSSVVLTALSVLGTMITPRTGEDQRILLTGLSGTVLALLLPHQMDGQPLLSATLPVSLLLFTGGLGRPQSTRIPAVLTIIAGILSLMAVGIGVPKYIQTTQPYEVLVKHVPQHSKIRKLCNGPKSRIYMYAGWRHWNACLAAASEGSVGPQPLLRSFSWKHSTDKGSELYIGCKRKGKWVSPSKAATVVVTADTWRIYKESVTPAFLIPRISPVIFQNLIRPTPPCLKGLKKSVKDLKHSRVPVKQPH